jgi:hypothetical protein
MVKPKIESGVPLPRPRGARTSWPFKDMVKGDSFEVPHGKTCNQASCAIRDFKKIHGGNFTIRKLANKTARVWCTRTPRAGV